MINWPIELPQLPLDNGYSRKSTESVIKFNTTKGRALQRNRSNAMPDNVTEQYYLTDAQRAILKLFYDVTTKSGTITFLKVEPETGQQLVYRISSPPKFDVSDLGWLVTCNMEVFH